MDVRHFWIFAAVCTVLSGCGSATVKYGRSVVSSEKVDANGALPNLERAVALNPNDPPSRYNLAIAQIATKDLEGAAAQRNALRSLDRRLADDVDARLVRMGRGP